ncbi:COP9 signalosome complex subunit 7 [Striga hermonthica]|uniref:COP9 signalosome complex subunit 7 n=1 Tax=Striga hermonthica TaxID=68872 RepID=A0A9N7NXA1_STRHE|nr:COP9 signalosome complex subunit 7 [Striga hermonthica]
MTSWRGEASAPLPCTIDATSWLAMALIPLVSPCLNMLRGFNCSMYDGNHWSTTSDSLLVSIQEKIKWADNMAEMDKKHREEIDERVEEVRKTLSLKVDIDLRGHEELFSEHGGVMDFDQDRNRPKRRRHPMG